MASAPDAAPLVLPALHVDHVSIAVGAIAPALDLLRRILPVRMGTEPCPGYDGQFAWADFFVGDRKIELIESARPGSFVERFLARHGEGFHHLSIEVEDGRFDAYTAALEARGLRIVDRGDYGGGNKTAFISPRTAPGILVQFWQVPGFHGDRAAGRPAAPVTEHDGVRFRIDHLALAVRSIDDGLAWFRRSFPVEARLRDRGWDGTHDVLRFRLAGYALALLEPRTEGGLAARHLARRGEGFHHLAMDVDDLSRLLGRLEAEGLRVLDRADPRGSRATAFVHPEDTHGLLLRFRQAPEIARGA